MQAVKQETQELYKAVNGSKITNNSQTLHHSAELEITKRLLDMGMVTRAVSSTEGISSLQYDVRPEKVPHE